MMFLNKFLRDAAQRIALSAVCCWDG